MKNIMLHVFFIIGFISFFGKELYSRTEKITTLLGEKTKHQLHALESLFGVALAEHDCLTTCKLDKKTQVTFPQIPNYTVVQIFIFFFKNLLIQSFSPNTFGQPPHNLTKVCLSQRLKP